MIVNILIALSMIGHNISAYLFNVQASCCATYLDHPIVTSVTTCQIDCTPGWHFGAISQIPLFTLREQVQNHGKTE